MKLTKSHRGILSRLIEGNGVLQSGQFRRNSSYQLSYFLYDKAVHTYKEEPVVTTKITEIPHKLIAPLIERGYIIPIRAGNKGYLASISGIKYYDKVSKIPKPNILGEKAVMQFLNKYESAELYISRYNNVFLRHLPNDEYSEGWYLEPPWVYYCLKEKTLEKLLKFKLLTSRELSTREWVVDSKGIPNEEHYIQELYKLTKSTIALTNYLLNA